MVKLEKKSSHDGAGHEHGRGEACTRDPMHALRVRSSTVVEGGGCGNEGVLRKWLVLLPRSTRGAEVWQHDRVSKDHDQRMVCSCFSLTRKLFSRGTQVDVRQPTTGASETGRVW